MSRELIEQLKRLRYNEVNPSEEWVMRTRQLLKARITNTVPVANRQRKLQENVWETLSAVLPSSFVYKVVRPVAVFLLVLVVGASGWIATVDASYNALPGDWLYSTKRATEKTQMAIAAAVGDKTTETKLHSEFAKRRALEAKKMVASADPVRIARVSQVVKDLKKEMGEVNNKLDQLKGASSKREPTNMAMAIHENSAQIKDVLKEVKNNLLTTTDTPSNITEEISSAREMAKDTAIRAVEVMTARHLNGDTTVSSEEMRDVIEQELQSTASEVAQSGQNTQDVRTAVETVQSEMRQMARETKSPALNAMTTTTQELVDRVNVAVQRTSVATAEVNKQVQSAQQLLSTGNLTQAIDVVRQVNETNMEVENIADDTLQAMQTVLPVVGVTRENGSLPGNSSVTSVNIIVTTHPVVSTSSTVSGTAAVLIVTTTPAPSANGTDSSRR